MLIDIDNISKDYTKKNILIIGDIILDAYEFGKVDRISQEAPVPIGAIDRENQKPGGAANIALNLSGLDVTVDPKHNKYDSCKGVRLFKPNLIEFNTNVKDKAFGELPEFGFLFKEYIDCEILLLTLGADGMSLYHNNDFDQIPTKSRKVYDVSGAGDTVISTFSINDIYGVEPLQSSFIAKFAAGKVCE